MSEAQSEMAVDARVTRVVEILLAYKQESWSELMIATGIGKSTMIRRKSRGGWSAAEVAVLAEHFDAPVELFYQGPDALFRGGPGRINRTYLTAA